MSRLRTSLADSAFAMTTTTRINGKHYDLRAFEHPGGSTALRLAHGRDATVLFNMHHTLCVRDRLLRVLAKHEVRAAEAVGDEAEPHPQFEWDSAFRHEKGDRACQTRL